MLRSELNKILKEVIKNQLKEKEPGIIPKKPKISYAKKLVKDINDEWDIEILELLKQVIEKRLQTVGNMVTTAQYKQIKGFKK